LNGQLTAVKTRILETAEHWLTSVNCYDIRGRLLQVVADNHLGGLELICNSYDFEGKLIKSRIIHNYNSHNLQHETLQYRYEYDNAGRMLNLFQQYCPSCNEIVYANYKYNESGQLIEKNLHLPKGGSGYLQSGVLNFNGNVNFSA
jgi:hypothetical protein